MEEKQIPQTIDEYIAGFPAEVQERMKQLRSTIHAAAPEAKEKISWGMATFTLNKKNLIHFAGHKNHIGIYPGVEAIVVFADELSAYKTSKGGIQLPLNKSLPLDLITSIVNYQVKELTS